ncbi:MAG: right-handed parallel beta-helix repeat-containing protein [Burkholderiales bacterium]|nr:MAG: right-handed parallel beta-helix repeat-containing protein [Burkholderiales bacterium]
MSRKLILLGWSFALFVGSIAGLSPAYAQATRTWVSGVGDDANPCSRTAPCKTFAGAISKTAAGGEINVLDPGGFGAVTVTKAVTIDGGGVLSGVLASGTNGIVVNAGAADVVVLRGLDINGIGTGLNGVRYLAAKELHIERCNIYGFSQMGVDAEASTVGHKVFIRDSSIHDNAAVAGGGIFMKPSGAATGSLVLDDVRLYANRFGLKVEGNVVAAVRNTQASGATSGGAFIALTGARIMLDHSTASGNDAAGVNAQSGATIHITNTTITSNNPGIFTGSGGQVISFGNNRIAGNVVNGAPTSTVAQQ